MSGESSNNLARSFLESVAGFTADPEGDTPSQDRPARIGTIDALDVGIGLPQVLFDGETVMGVKGYPWLGRRPLAGERVVLMPVGRSYVITGIINDAPPVRYSAGSAVVAIVVTGASLDIPITFPAGRFTVPPILVATIGNNRLNIQAGAITTSGATLRVTNYTPVTTSAATAAYWQATQMTAATAAG